MAVLVWIETALRRLRHDGLLLESDRVTRRILTCAGERDAPRLDLLEQLCRASGD